MRVRYPKIRTPRCGVFVRDVSGDTLVIDTIGLRADTWIDWNGSVLTQPAKVWEQTRRPDFGHLEIQITVDDLKTYTKPWTVILKRASLSTQIWEPESENLAVALGSDAIVLQDRSVW
jgi:hypothetical protein